jgi:hypothetical protein
MKPKSTILGLCLTYVPWITLVSCLGCGLLEARYLPYPKSSIQAAKPAESCAIEIAAFTTYVTPMLKERCMTGCHTMGGTAERVLAFFGNAEKDSITLKQQEDGTAQSIYRKAAGLVAHGGGEAALVSDLERFEKWFAAAKLCPRPQEQTRPFNGGPESH